MHQLTHFTKAQTQIIESGMAIVAGHFAGSLLERRSSYQCHRPKVKFIAKAALLIINHRGFYNLAFAHLIAVGVTHHGIAVVGNLHHTLQGMQPQLQHVAIAVNECILALRGLGNGFDGSRRRKRIHSQRLAPINCYFGIAHIQHKAFVNHFRRTQRRQCGCKRLLSRICHK